MAETEPDLALPAGFESALNELGGVRLRGEEAPLRGEEAPLALSPLLGVDGERELAVLGDRWPFESRGLGLRALECLGGELPFAESVFVASLFSHMAAAPRTLLAPPAVDFDCGVRVAAVGLDIEVLVI